MSPTSGPPAQRGVVRPWQVWLVDFDPQVGHEQAGRRPVIVVGSAYACGLPNGLVLLVPCTTRTRGWAHHVPVALTEPSYAMCDQARATSTDRLVHLLPQSPNPTERDAIRFALLNLLA